MPKSTELGPGRTGMHMARTEPSMLTEVRPTFSRLPWLGGAQLQSSASSLYMLARLDGTRCPGGTEKLRPIAWPSLWYGSCARSAKSQVSADASGV